MPGQVTSSCCSLITATSRSGSSDLRNSDGAVLKCARYVTGLRKCSIRWAVHWKPNRLPRVVDFLASSYFQTAIIGLVVAALGYCFAAVSDPALAHDRAALLYVLVLGPLTGCLATFGCRRLIDLASGRRPQFKISLADIGDLAIAAWHGKNALLALTIAASIFAAIVLLAGNLVELKQATAVKCKLLKECWHAG